MPLLKAKASKWNSRSLPTSMRVKESGARFATVLAIFSLGQ